MKSRGRGGGASATRYAEAGVGLDRADRAVESIRGIVSSTFNAAVVGAFGGFGGAFDLERFPGGAGSPSGRDATTRWARTSSTTA